MKVRFLLIGLLCFLIFVIGCSPDGQPVDTTENRVFIEDRSGREWDITHAQEAYNMIPNYFNFGLGVGVIASVDNPQVISEGSIRYPPADSNRVVFGVDHNGEQRAYEFFELGNHEVFNDVYPGKSNQYVSVTF